jgi:hypothetical protein
MSHSVSPPILNVTILDEEASFGMVRDKVSVVNIEGIHMSGLRIKAFSPESRMKRVAPSARKSLDLPAASAMKANNIVERYSLEEREQIAEILRILSAKPQQFRLWATDEPTAARIRVVDNEGCTVFEQNSDFYRM